MQINITGRHLDITPAIRDYVNSKFERIQRHTSGITSINVILSVEKLIQKSEAEIHLPGNVIFADAQDENLYASIDALIDKLDRQVVKHKEKMTQHQQGARI